MNSSNGLRVVVTGIGSISPLGHNAVDFWDALSNGRSGIGTTTCVDPALLNIKICAEVKNYDPLTHFSDRELLLLDRFSQFALIAAKEAIADSGLDFRSDLGIETACITGTGAGGFITLDESFEKMYRQKAQRIHPMTIPHQMVSAATSQITMKHGIRGPSYSVSSACSSANHAIGDAYWMIRAGRARAAVTGGSEASLTLGAIRAWESVRVMAPDTCRPFTKNRKGMVLGEGAGIVVLEELEHAKKRGARIYAEVCGFGMSADAGDIVVPSEDGAAAAMRQAIKTSGLNADQFDYINAHGTGTGANDGCETRAIKKAFGEHARKLAISSTKSMHGHALGGAGAIEMVGVVKAVAEGVMPPTANYDVPDPECDLDYVPNTARRKPIHGALSNSFAFGGLNAVVALKKFS
ncbi:MAG: beta-ketoacyl synthase [Alphaproteobacteria bacterium]